MVYTGLSLFIIRRAYLYLVVCVLTRITLQSPYWSEAGFSLKNFGNFKNEREFYVRWVSNHAQSDTNDITLGWFNGLILLKTNRTRRKSHNQIPMLNSENLVGRVMVGGVAWSWGRACRNGGQDHQDQKQYQGQCPIKVKPKWRSHQGQVHDKVKNFDLGAPPPTRCHTTDHTPPHQVFRV